MHKSESSSDPPGPLKTDPDPGQGSNVEESSINDLPPEMLLQVLQCVDTRTLFACRLVNRQWNWISSRILCHRPDAQVSFGFTKTDDFMGHEDEVFGVGKNRTFPFLRCMKKSKSCPYAHFSFFISFHVDPPDFFSDPRFTKFLSYFSSSSPNADPNKRIKGLHLNFRTVYGKPLEIMAAKIRDLLLDKTPFVENLSLEFECSKNASHVKLFSGPNKKHVEINPDKVPTSVSVEPELEFQLPHLKTLRFKSSFVLHCSGILEDLLSAAVNLEKIYVHPTQCLPHFFFAIKTFELLQSLGKFHLLKSFNFDLSNECLSRLRGRSDFTRALFNLELEELALGTTGANHNLHNADYNTNATTLISRLFESQKDSLKKLEIGPLRFLPNLQLPTFKNLTHLKLNGVISRNRTFFPPGIQSLDVFLAVRNLDLPNTWRRIFSPFESLPVFRNVNRLNVDDARFTESCISVLNLLCPNLKHLRIHKEKLNGLAPKLEFLPVGREIWRLMTQLESLEVDIEVDLIEENSSAQLDSCFTGISVEKVQRLYQMREAESNSEMPTEREHPSILDMKSLNKLRINPYEEVYGRLEKMDKKEFYTEKLTWISHDYAFKLLPNLTLN